jgi:hypothetical protein
MEVDYFGVCLWVIGHILLLEFLTHDMGLDFGGPFDHHTNWVII